MTEESRPGFLANYKIVWPGPVRFRPGPQFKKSARARPAFGPARLTPLLKIVYFYVIDVADSESESIFAITQ